MRLAEIQSKNIDPDVFEDLDPDVIVDVGKKIIPGIEWEISGEGYVEFNTKDGLHLCIGASVADGAIDINLAAGAGRLIRSGTHKGAITSIIAGVYDVAVSIYGLPSKKGTITCYTDAGFGVWQHIAKKLGMDFEALSTK